MPRAVHQAHDQYIIALYMSGKTLKEMRELGVPSRTLYDALNRNGIAANRLSTYNRDALIESYYAGTSILEIAKQAGISKWYVHKLIKDWNCTIRSPKHTENSNYFDCIDTERKAYWLGYIYGDGNVDRNLRGLTIAAHAKDLSHMQTFLADIESDALIRKVSDGGISLTIWSTELARSLEKVGVVPNKHAVIRMPDLVSDLIPHFVRGLFDADGCVDVRLRWTLVSNPRMLNDVRQVLIQRVGVTKSRMPYNNKYSAADTLMYGSKKDVCLIRDWQYDNSTVWLARKRERLDLR